MAVSTTWGLSVVLLGISLLVVSSLESTTFEVSQNRPLLNATMSTMIPRTTRLRMGPEYRSTDVLMAIAIQLHVMQYTMASQRDAGGCSRAHDGIYDTSEDQ